MKMRRFGSAILPAIGQGAGGTSPCSDSDRIKALQYGIEIGLNLIDTAEDYGDGHSEEIVGRAITGRREKVFVATKFSPEHSHYDDVIKALEGSLKRLNTDYVDLYQIHWPNLSVPVKETLYALATLKASGKIKYIGVSNFSLDNLIEAQKLFEGEIFSNQIEYNLCERAIEEDIIPYSQQNKIAVLAYNPLYRGRITVRYLLDTLAKKYEKTSVQVILNWLTLKPNVIPIQASNNLEHIKQNAISIDFTMEKKDIETINRVSESKIFQVSTEKIRVIITDSKIKYTTIEDALLNKLNLQPNIHELAKDILTKKILKPIRLVPTTDSNGRYKYDLIRGKMRFWAWILAYGKDKPIPAYVNDFPY